MSSLLFRRFTARTRGRSTRRPDRLSAAACRLPRRERRDAADRPGAPRRRGASRSRCSATSAGCRWSWSTPFGTCTRWPRRWAWSRCRPPPRLRASRFRTTTHRRRTSRPASGLRTPIWSGGATPRFRFRAALVRDVRPAAGVARVGHAGRRAARGAGGGRRRLVRGPSPRPRARVLFFDHGDEVRSSSGTGPYRREGSLDDGKPGCVRYRPMAHGLIVFDRRTWELRINAATRASAPRTASSSASTSSAGPTSSRRPGAVRPRAAPGRSRNSLACKHITGLASVRLVEAGRCTSAARSTGGRSRRPTTCCWRSSTPASRSPDALLVAAPRSRCGSPTAASPGRSRSGTATATYTRDTDADLIEAFLRGGGFVKGGGHAACGSRLSGCRAGPACGRSGASTWRRASSSSSRCCGRWRSWPCPCRGRARSRAGSSSTTRTTSSRSTRDVRVRAHPARRHRAVAARRRHAVPGRGGGAGLGMGTPPVGRDGQPPVVAGRLRAGRGRAVPGVLGDDRDAKLLRSARPRFSAVSQRPFCSSRPTRAGASEELNRGWKGRSSAWITLARSLTVGGRGRVRAQAIARNRWPSSRVATSSSLRRSGLPISEVPQRSPRAFWGRWRTGSDSDRLPLPRCRERQGTHLTGLRCTTSMGMGVAGTRKPHANVQWALLYAPPADSPGREPWTGGDGKGRRNQKRQQAAQTAPGVLRIDSSDPIGSKAPGLGDARSPSRTDH